LGFLESYSEFTEYFTKNDLEYFVNCIRYAVDRNEFIYKVTNGESLVQCMWETFEKVKKQYSSMEKIVQCANILFCAGKSVGINIQDSYQTF
jgi:hypothetical protein